MEAALTSRSVADIIAVSQHVVQLGHALYFGATGDNTKMYQALRESLEIFVRILM